MNDVVEQLDGVVSLMISADVAPTAESIRETIGSMRLAGPFATVTDEQAERLARELEERIGISMGLGAVVGERTFRPWLSDARASGKIEPYYWNRYRKLLQSKRMPIDVITSTDAVTDRILDRMGNPHDEGEWDRKGMVVGHVQSGKTANYTGLVCKAADAGYRLIIVIAGIHNNLRNQTQARIDEGFVGRDTGRLEQRSTRERPRTIGVGTFDDRRPPVSLTTTLRDFNKATATTNTSQIGSYSVPVVLVIKKNSSTLANLVDWLREHSAGRRSEMVDQPMLLIDDEADNASINIAYGRDEVSRINGQIRDLLGLFRRSCYVGYTATPFANIFIDPDSEDQVYRQDLFPRHFIIGLDAPTNYFGPRKVFVDGVPDDENGTPAHLRYIGDNADILPVKHRIGHQLDELPASLVRALRAFLIARAVRNLRGQQAQHSSMLVNASRFTGVQLLIRNRLHERLKTIEEAIRVDGSRPDAAKCNEEIAALRAVWSAEYEGCGHEWVDVLSALLPVVASASLVAVNSQSSDNLDYDNAGGTGLTVIAVGGFSLSRGLTLEGLIVSYFLRNSLMYDTLMQMGRWFGYRTGYEDLCRIWMLPEAAAWYAHISDATEELQQELKRMEQANATPEQFGLAVRSHPSALMVTARNKMGSGEKHVMVGLSNNFVETTKLRATGSAVNANRGARDRLLRDLSTLASPETAEKVPGGLLVRDAPVDTIDAFLRDFENERESILTDTRPIRSYIASRRTDELRIWDVLVTSRNSAPDDEKIDINGWRIAPISRSIGPDDVERGVLSISGKRARVASRGMEKAGLTEDQALAAEAAYRKEKGLAANAATNFPDRVYRAVRTRPLLILFNLLVRDDDLTDGQKKKVPEGPLVGWGISFPRSARPDEKVEYILNTTKLREFFGEDDSDEGFGDGDE